jgi:hypothetical protein
MTVVRPLVTVIITAYNYARYLPRSLGQVLTQDYAPLEVLVMDNASTDETPAVLERYSSDPRLRVVRNERNVGATPNHNHGLQYARGDYIVFLSADDELAPGSIARAMAYYDTHPEIDIVYGWTYRIDGTGRETGVYGWPGLPRAAYDGGRNELANTLAFGGHKFLPTMVVPRTIWDRFGGFDESLVSADWDVEARWAAGGVRYGMLPEPLAFVRDHGSNTGQLATGSGTEMRDAAKIFERHLRIEDAARFAGYEHALMRTFQQRDVYFRGLLGSDAHDEIGATTARLTARVEAILRANAGRRKTRLVYIVPADDAIGALAATLASLASLDDPGWRAIVVQQPGLSSAAICARVDSARIRHAHLIGPRTTSEAINTAMSIEDADVYVVLRAGARVPPNHVSLVLDAFADAGVRLALTWATVVVRSHEPPLGSASPVDARASAPSNIALVVTPQLEPESVAFARSTVDEIGYYPEAGPLSDWAFLILASLGGGIRMTEGTVEACLWPGMRDGRLGDPRAVATLDELFSRYPIADAQASAQRAAFRAHIEATHHRGLATAEDLAGLYAFPG